MSKNFIEFTGTISEMTFLDKEAFLLLKVENAEDYRIFELPGRNYGIQLREEYDIERHKRYDLGMDTNMVFIVRNSNQSIVSYRWKTMRQISELIRYVVDQTKVSEYENGLKKAIVWMQKLQPIVDFSITDEVIDEVYKALKAHPNIESVEKNGGWFVVWAKI